MSNTPERMTPATVVLSGALLLLAGCICTVSDERAMTVAETCRASGGEPMFIPVSKYNNAIRSVRCVRRRAP